MEGESSQSAEVKDEIVQLYNHLSNLYDSHASLQTQVNYLTQRVLMLEVAASQNIGAGAEEKTQPALSAATVKEAVESTGRSQKRRTEKSEKKSGVYTPLIFPVEEIFEFIK